MKKIFIFIMIFILTVGCMAGCKSAPAEEESAAAGEYVESTIENDSDKDAPVKVDPNQEPEKMEDPGNGNSSSGGNSGTTNTPSGGNSGSENNGTDNGGSGDDPVDTPDDNGGEDGEEEPEVTYKTENKLKILDYNVRYTDDGPGKLISERAPRLKKLAEQLDPDLMGFQEATPTWMGLLKDYFGSEYGCSYKERSPGDESSPVFWKKSKFEKLDEGYFWLSETPDVQSKGWTAGHYRICSWVKLKIKATGKEFLYFNAHWDGGDEVHVGSSQLTLARARKLGAFSKYAMFLTADFNMVPWSKGYNVLVESGELGDVNADLDNLQDGTIDGYNEGKEEQRIIDMCFYSINKAVPVSYRILNEMIDGGYISDHRGWLIEVAVL